MGLKYFPEASEERTAHQLAEGNVLNETVFGLQNLVDRSWSQGVCIAVPETQKLEDGVRTGTWRCEVEVGIQERICKTRS